MLGLSAVSGGEMTELLLVFVVGPLVPLKLLGVFGTRIREWLT